MGLEKVTMRETNGEVADSVRRAVLLAAAPHVLYAFLTILGDLGIRQAANWFGYGMLGALVAAMLLAWRKQWPLWSASWLGYAVLFAFFASSFALASLFATVTLQFDYLLAVLPVVIVLGVTVFQRRPLYGLLGSLPFLVLWERFFTFELVLGGAWVFAGVWLLAALTAGGIVWLHTMRHAVVLVVVFHLISGVAFALGRGYLPYRWPELHVRQAPTWQELVNDFVPLTLALIALTLAFLLLHPLRRLAMVLEGDGRRIHILLLGGAVVAVGGRIGMKGQGAGAGGAALGLGLALALAAALLLARSIWHARGKPTRALLVPVLVAFAPLVVFSLATPFAPDGSYSAGFQRMLILSYAGVLLWIGVAMWVLLHNDRNTRVASHSPGARPDHLEDHMVGTEFHA